MYFLRDNFTSTSVASRRWLPKLQWQGRTVEDTCKSNQLCFSCSKLRVSFAPSVLIKIFRVFYLLKKMNDYRNLNFIPMVNLSANYRIADLCCTRSTSFSLSLSLSVFPTNFGTSMLQWYRYNQNYELADAALSITISHFWLLPLFM